MVMERIKREQDITVQDYHVNKKQKVQHQNNNINKCIFEHLPNEIIYEIFEYLETHHIYEGFYSLNKRFKHLLEYSNLLTRINISNMSKTSFERCYIKIILPNRHRINYLRLSNPFTSDIVFSPSSIVRDFIHLETLVLNHINEKSFNNIAFVLTSLPKLQSLIIDFAEHIKCPSIPFTNIFYLKHLKYCKITYEEKGDCRPWPIDFTEYGRCRIEYLVINTRFPFDSLNGLLLCLPKLRYLSINSLVNCHYLAGESNDANEMQLQVILKYLKSVSFKLEAIDFDRLEYIIKKFFHQIEVLHLTTRYDTAYLDAKRWEDLILTSMPYLRAFDINCSDGGLDNRITFHDLIQKFHSSFWIEKQWFFTHQHTWSEDLNSGMLYSTKPYQRKDYTFYWQSDKQFCPYITPTNINSVKHICIASKRITNNPVNYFPNATELTMKHNLETSNDSIPQALNRILPLKQLRKLVIDGGCILFQEIIKLVRHTPNLHTLKFNMASLVQINSTSFRQNQIFQRISNTNKIKYLEVGFDLTFERVQLILELFPQLEYMKIDMKKEEINQIVRFLLTKTNPKTRHLCFLCISQIPKRCLKEINMLIKCEKLVEDHHIKFVNRDLHLWW